jgi:hypothetical protein
MSDNKYHPRHHDLEPLDENDEVRPYLEMLAESIHDQWAAARIEEGWRWGAIHDSITRQTPNLVRYQELPEAERKLDREMVLLVLGRLKYLGFHIERKKAED